MIELIGKKVLVTCQNWFLGPDGKTYKAVWGELKGVFEAGKTLGFIPNRAHANWYLTVGAITIMGCQAMYVLDCPIQPPNGDIEDYAIEGGACKPYTRPSQILILTD